MGEVITNLKAKFSVESQDVSSGMRPAEDALTKLEEQVGELVGGFKNMFTPLAVLGAAGGAFATLKGAMESVEGPGDRLEKTMGGVKEALWEAGRALGSMDFKNFFSNLNEGFERGKAFAETLDGLADRVAYNDYRINQMKRESAELQETVKNKTLEISVRADAARKVEAIEEQIRDRRVKLAEDEFMAQKQMWEARNRMETEEAIKLYETIDNMGNERWNYKATLSAGFAEAMKRTYNDVDKAIEQLRNDSMFMRGIPPEVFESYAKYFRLLETGEADVLKKLFNTYKTIDEVAYKAQEDYNGTVAQTTRLLEAEEKAVDKLGKTAKKAAPELEKISFAGGGAKDVAYMNNLFEMKVPDWGPMLTGLKVIKKEVKNTAVELKTSLIDVSNIIEDSLSKSIAGFGEWLGEFAVGMADGNDLVKMVGTMFGDMLIQLGEVAIAAGIGLKAIKAAFESMNPLVAIGAGIALIALGSAIKASVSNIGSSMGSGSGSGPSSGNSGYTYDTRGFNAPGNMQTVRLIGEFRLKNNELVAAIDQEEKRVSSST